MTFGSGKEDGEIRGRGGGVPGTAAPDPVALSALR